MAQFRVPDVAEIAHLTAVTAATMTLRLFTNQIEAGLTPTQIEALDDADFTEATFTGYNAATLTGGSWTVTGGNPTRAQYTQQSFTSSADQTAQTIWGYYLLEGSALRGYRQFDAPLTVEFELEEIRITPIIDLSDTQGDTMPTGSIVDFAGSTPPVGWLICDGSAVSRTTYADLYAVVDDTYGDGDGSTTFNLPDNRGRHPIGVAASGTASSLGDTGGALDHTHGLGAGYARIEADGSDFNYDRVPASYTTDSRADFTGSSSAVSGTNDGGVTLGGTTEGGNAPFIAYNRIIKT